MFAGYYVQNWRTKNLMDFDKEGVSIEILSLFFVGFFFFCCLALNDSGCFMGCTFWNVSPTKKSPSESDVKMEQMRVEQICADHDFGDTTLAANKLEKLYGAFHAVKGISFAVAQKVGTRYAPKRTLLYAIQVPCFETAFIATTPILMPVPIK